MTRHRKEGDNMSNENINETGENTNGLKQWMQDNLRIIVSILIVFAIASGIYSYSRRTEAPVSTEEISQIETVSEDEAPDENTVESEEEATQPEQDSQETVASQETEGSFIETAQSGEGATHLARRALANYLEKNPDSSLTPEHKIYIEDFLRKNVQKKSIDAGTSMEFSKDLIQNAITKSKNLNEKQLQNLQKYSSRVPSLR